MAGGASWDVTQQSGDTTKVFGMREDSCHESNLGTKWIEEWHISDMTTLATLVFLEIVFPTRHKEHGSPKYYHMVEQYYHRLLSRQSSSLKILMVPRAVALFTRKITTVTLSGMRSALTVYADRDVAV